MAIAPFEPGHDADMGRLANNFIQVKSLQTILSRSDSNLTVLPNLFSRIARDECWREWVNADGDFFGWNEPDFREFIESPRPRGCQTPIHVLERFLRGTEAWEVYLNLTRGKQGSGPGGNNPEGLGGKSHKAIDDRDNVTVINDPPADGERPCTIPLSSAKPERDYSREAPTGNSVSYALRRLSKERPDLYERVKAGEMTAHAAKIEAGFSLPSITLLKSTRYVINGLIKHFGPADLAAIVQGLAEHLATEES